ncbi:hypothetical protein ACJX0J_026730, partial [Zea mays]
VYIITSTYTNKKKELHHHVTWNNVPTISLQHNGALLFLLKAALAGIHVRADEQEQSESEEGGERGALDGQSIIKLASFTGYNFALSNDK